jgi:HAD superfamily hydrolase (TIGR01490 family)
MDGTLLSGNSGRLFAQYLRQRGAISRRRLLRSAWWLLRYQVGMSRMEEVWTRALAGAAGTPEAETIAACAEFAARELVPRAYPRCLALARAHREAGHRVVVLSASTLYVVRPVCEALGIDDYLCTRLEVEAGCFTGRPDGGLCFGAGKVGHAAALCEAAGIDLRDCWFYTDSYSDLPMLEAVGHPRPVNPDPRLRLAARLRGWPVAWLDTGVTHRAHAGDALLSVIA